MSELIEMLVWIGAGLVIGYVGTWALWWFRKWLSK